jgi:hypothetical protein
MATEEVTAVAESASIPVTVCSQIVEAAVRSCEPVASVPPSQPDANWDAMAVALTSQANAVAWGAVIIAVIIAIAGIAWGRIIAMNAEQEARETAEKEVKKWLQDDGLPLVLREVNEFLRTFPRETPISEDDVAAMVAAAGADGKEATDGQK